MRTIIDNYRRPLLAIFGVLLMVVFTLPANLKSGADARNNPVIGHIGKADVHAVENSNAEREWEILTRRVVFHTQNPQNPWIPIAFALLPMSGPQESVASEINAHRQSYLLLLKEAELRGVTITPAEVESVLNNPGLAVVDNGRVVSFSDLPEDSDATDQIRAAVTHLLLVQSSYQTAANTIKVSQPLRRFMIAQQAQTMSLAVVDVPTGQFTPPTPTQQQLDEQFKKYADVSPNDLEKSPQGYGYRFPDRVKLQSIAVPAAEVRAAAERARTKDAAADYEWRRDAVKYYNSNLDKFPTTQASATTAPASPTTRPFAQAEKEARAAVLDADVAKLTQRILDRITSQMAGDYVAYRNAIAIAGTATAKLPSSSVNVPFNSYEYLQRLADQVQKSFNLLPPTNSYDKNYLTQLDLVNLPGLGQTGIDRLPFAAYVLTRAAAFAGQQDEGKTLQLFEPSPILHDELGNAYLFRLTDAQKAHAPASIQEVAAAVDADVRAAAKFEQAKKAADEIVAKAKPPGSLQTAAAPNPVINLANLHGGDTTPLAPLNLGTQAARASFLRQSFDLMSATTKDNPHPTGVIELPRDGRALVAQVTNVHTDMTADDLAAIEPRAAAEVAAGLAQPLNADWFRYDAIVARLNFQPTAANDHARPSAPANPNDSPANQPLF